MSNTDGFKLATLAASIALAMASTAALAAAPTATQLPGAGVVVTGTAPTVSTITSGNQTITLSGNTVINWGVTSGATINAAGTASSQPGGFNIGSGATLAFGGTGAVLNVDVSGNASQIFGGLSSSAGNLFVANANGIIVGSTATISASAGDVGLIPNTLGTTSGFDGTIGSVGIIGTGGSVTVNTGASIDGTNVLIFGGLTNSGQITTAGGTRVTGGDLVNNGQISTGYTQVTAGNLINGGAITGGGFVDVYDGNITNSGSMAVITVSATNGSIVNNGTITHANYFQTSSNAHDSLFIEGADYSITNNGTITSPDYLNFYANVNQTNKAGTFDVLNGSTGSFTNTGTLQVNSSNSGLQVYTNNNISLGGKLQTVSGTTVTAVSASNPLDSLGLLAGGYGNDELAFTSSGTVTVSTPVSTEGVFLAGNQVSLLSNFSSVNTGNVGNYMNIVAGTQQASGYAVRVGSGVTVSADGIAVYGDVATDHPNVLINGTLAANAISFGGGFPGYLVDPAGAISNLFTGPSGSLVMYNNGTRNPYLALDFTGTVKMVPYNNASNFRFNGLNVNVTDGSPLTVELNPSAYATNGTSNGLSAVNLLVNSDVTLQSDLSATTAGAPTANGSAVTGVITLPNTHLVLQSSGSITTQGNAVKNFYWPGYVYLGTVSANADGSAAPGTLGQGTITTEGGFNNVLPGDIAGASGIHFITQSPMVLGGNVITNANAWVNFGTDLLTSAYAGGTLGAGAFFGGTQGSGTVVNYGPLASADFVTQTPSATP